MQVQPSGFLVFEAKATIFSLVLLPRKRELEEEINRMEAELTLQPDFSRAIQGGSLGDAGTRTTTDRETNGELASLRAILASVDKAISKVSAGTYGHCDDCGKPIDPERLQAFPHATCCVGCKAGGKRY